MLTFLSIIILIALIVALAIISTRKDDAARRKGLGISFGLALVGYLMITCYWAADANGEAKLEAFKADSATTVEQERNAFISEIAFDTDIHSTYTVVGPVGKGPTPTGLVLMKSAGSAEAFVYKLPVGFKVKSNELVTGMVLSYIPYDNTWKVTPSPLQTAKNQ